MLNGTDQQFLEEVTQSLGQDAFPQVVDRYAGMVYSTCSRVLRDEARAFEATQETFLELLRDGDRVAGSLAGWLHRVATRRAIDIIRQDESRVQREKKYASDAETSSSYRLEIEALVDEALEALEDEPRELLTLHYLEEKSTIEIAAQKGVSQRTICRRITEALEEVRLKLDKKGAGTGILPLKSILSSGIGPAPQTLLDRLGKLSGLEAGAANATVAATGAFGGAGLKIGLAVIFVILAGLGMWASWRSNFSRKQLRMVPAVADPNQMVKSQAVGAATLEASGAILPTSLSTTGLEAAAERARMWRENAVADALRRRALFQEDFRKRRENSPGGLILGRSWNREEPADGSTNAIESMTTVEIKGSSTNR